MRIVALDDEQIALQGLMSSIRKAAPDAELAGFSDPFEALEYMEKNRTDVAFLDIEMPGMTGLEVARTIKEKWPSMNVIMATAYGQYAVDAMQMYISGYLMKPIRQEKVREALDNLRFPVEEALLRVQCFGNFDVFYKDGPVPFGRSKAKEMFAYLVDLRGSSANTAEICGILWEDEGSQEKKKSYFRQVVSELRKAMAAFGAEDVRVFSRDSFAVDTRLLDCDYYHFLEDDPAAVNAYNGEFMKQYSWAERDLWM